MKLSVALRAGGHTPTAHRWVAAESRPRAYGALPAAPATSSPAQAAPAAPAAGSALQRDLVAAIRSVEPAVVSIRTS